MGKTHSNPISLEDPQDYDLSSSSPPAFSWSFTAECRLIALDFAFERLGTFFSNAQYLADRAKETLNGWKRSRPAKPKAIGRNAPYKTLQKLFLGSIRYTKRIPNAFKNIAGLTMTALVATVAESPRPAVAAVRTRSMHLDPILSIF